MQHRLDYLDRLNCQARITDFANRLRAQGMGVLMRLSNRPFIDCPILMTTAAMVLARCRLLCAWPRPESRQQSIGDRRRFASGYFFSLIVIPVVYSYLAPFRKIHLENQEEEHKCFMISLYYYFYYLKLYGIYVATQVGIVATAIQVLLTLAKKKMGPHASSDLNRFCVIRRYDAVLPRSYFCERANRRIWIFASIILFTQFTHKSLLQRFMKRPSMKRARRYLCMCGDVLICCGHFSF